MFPIIPVNNNREFHKKIEFIKNMWFWVDYVSIIYD